MHLKKYKAVIFDMDGTILDTSEDLANAINYAPVEINEGVKKSVDWQLKNLKTDYIDFGFMHCLDEFSDLETYEQNGVLRYLLSMKEQGVVRHLGLSTHAPALANRVPDMKLIDMMMFSINPMYDQIAQYFGI